MIDHVAIIGGGFSGTLQAINLLRHDGPRATLIERRAVAGEGVAYGAAHPSHLLNVRASNMSAFPDEPDHFVRWLAARGMPDPAGAFIPRLTYGTYLRELLDDAQARAGDRLTIVAGEAIDVVGRSGGGARLTLADGRIIDAEAAILAVGNLPPHTPPGLDPDGLPHGVYRADPWEGAVADGLGPDDTVLILGTGLTMVDVALMLDARGFAGRIVALSRRGLSPRAHGAAARNPCPINERPLLSPAALLQRVRVRAGTIGWFNAVDELRPFTQDMWRVAGHSERTRFLRHLRAWWDVHRHRLAPEVHARVEAMRRDGRIEIVAGKLIDSSPHARGAAVRWRERGGEDVRTLVAQRIINCTGPQGDLTRTDDPLLRALAARGTIRPDSARLGIDVDPQARTIAAGGGANDWLSALGPMTRGAFWEIVAVPDIRAQTWSVARRLSNAHWVGGEGL